MKSYESLIWNFFRGKRTYLVGALAIAYGWYFKDTNAIILGLGLFGIRAGIANDIAKMMEEKGVTQVPPVQPQAPVEPVVEPPQVQE